MPLQRWRPLGLVVASALACGRGGASDDTDAGRPAISSPAGSGSPGSPPPRGLDADAASGRGANEGAAAGALDATRPTPGADAVSRDAGADDSGAPSVPCLDFSEPAPIGSIESPELDQLSGLVASRSQDGVLFAHEDSTGEPIVYALDTQGRSLVTFTLAGAPNSDWEDIAIGPGPSGSPELFIGDIGDNAVRTNAPARAELQVIRLPEPSVALDQPASEQTLTDFDVLRFRYPDGVHESETLLVHPVTGDILLVTRASNGDSRVFRAPGSTPPDTLTALQEVARVGFDPSGQGALATAGDIAPSGDRVLLRTYTRVYVWPAPSGAALADVFQQAPTVMDWAVEPQGEAISFAPDGRSWFAASEQERTIYRAAARCP